MAVSIDQYRVLSYLASMSALLHNHALTLVARSGVENLNLWRSRLEFRATKHAPAVRSSHLRHASDVVENHEMSRPLTSARLLRTTICCDSGASIVKD
jgi:hypothetical protein